MRPETCVTLRGIQPTNLLFILSDEHNRDCLGCYGHPLVRTPHLDRLAGGGARFTAAYCNCPICVPSRASLATGRYVHQIGHWDNAFPYDGRVRGWGHRLAAAGHRVDAIGKLHFRSVADDDGFTNKILPLNVVDGVGDVMGSVRDELPMRPGTREGVTSAGPGRSTYLDYDEEIATRACDWLADAARRHDERPWVLFTSFVCPHPPFIAPPDLYALYPLESMPLPVQNRLEDQPHHPALDNLRRAMQYDEPFAEAEIRRVTAAYYGACTHLDRQVGRVLAALHQQGLAETTRVIYTSDHGESMGRRGLWGKFTMYEESVAVPLIVSGPGVPAGVVSADPVSLVDAYPTILEAVGLPLTEDERLRPGRSLWPIAAGHPLHRAVFSEYHAVASTTASYMLRSGRFKLVFYVGYPPQLFDLAADPDECHDLAALADYRPVVSAMEQQLRDLLDPEATDARAKADQRALVARHGGRDAVLAKGSFVNSPVPGETPTYRPGRD